MIADKKKLYLIENMGEATAHIITEFTDDELNSIIDLFNRINHSYQDYAPELYIYEVSWSEFKECENISDDVWDDSYVPFDCRFEYCGKMYTWAEEFGYYKYRKNILRCRIDECRQN